MTFEQIRLRHIENTERRKTQTALDFIKFDRLTANAFPLNMSAYVGSLPRGETKNFYAWVRERTQSGVLGFDKDMRLVRLKDSPPKVLP